MGVFEFIGTYLTFNEIAVMAIFLTFIFMLFRGVPVAMALVGTGLIFVVLAQFLFDPLRPVLREAIDFDRINLSHQRL